MLSCFAAAVACTSAGSPTFEQATRQLDLDAGSLLAASGLPASSAEPSAAIEDTSCVPGQVRHLFHAEGEIAQSPMGLLDKLQAMGYAEVADDLDLREESLDVSVLRNPETNLTFELTMLDGHSPNIRIVGKTTCYAPAPASSDDAS
jgi:hypothetical protein